MTVRKAIILTAGKGSRLGRFTDHIPKPMLRIHNRPIIESHVRRMAAAGVWDIWINLHHAPEPIRVHFGDVPAAERQRVRQHLEVYCARDTEGMVWIVDELRKLVAGGDSRPLTIRLYSGSASSNAALSRRWPTRAISRPLSTARPSNVELKQPGSDYTRPVLERKSVFHVPGGRLPPSYELFDFARVRLLAVCSQQSLYDLFSFVHSLSLTTRPIRKNA